MMRARGLPYFLAAAITLLSEGSPAHAIPDWSFDTIPAGGDVEGPPGSTVGWGYTLTNPDPESFLALTGLTHDPVANGAPLALFDFPIVPPLETLSVPYDGVNGLFQLTWDATAPVGFTNGGVFVLSADWYNGDPLAGGTLVEAAPDRNAPYSATVARPVSEPPLRLWLASGLAGVAALASGRRTRHACARALGPLQTP